MPPRNRNPEAGTVPTVPADHHARATAPPPAGFGVDFLRWLRQVTERTWAEVEEPTAADCGARWRRGTRWTGGLDDATITQVERRYGVRFPSHYRLFVKTLHSTTPWMLGGDFSRYGDRLAEYEAPGFYDWLHDGPQIRDAMRKVAHTMRELPFDGQDWQKTWTRRDPKPALIPVFGHRYVVADDSQWVLSIVEYDATIFVSNLRDYLPIELEDVLS